MNTQGNDYFYHQRLHLTLKIKNQQMKSKELQIKLIEYIDRFEQENPQLETYEMTDFLSYMESAFYGSTKTFPVRKIGGEKKPSEIPFREGTPDLLSRQISLLYRYTKGYAKKALKGSDLQTIEEFSFLVILLTYEHLSKTELIQKNVMNKTSGSEVIKRLRKKKLIRQFADEKDKRSQLVAITPDGIREMKKIFPEMQLSSEIVKGNLSVSEQQVLLFLLQKLESYHHHLFLYYRDEPLQQLKERTEETTGKNF